MKQNISVLSTVSGGGYLASAFMTWLNKPLKTDNDSISRDLLGDIDGNEDDRLIPLMKKKCNYLASFGLLLGVLTFVTSYIETIFLTTLWALLVRK